MVILLAEIAFGIFAAVYANKFREFISPTLEASIKYEYYGDMSNKTIVSIAWDVIMYNVSKFLNEFFLKIPIALNSYLK